MNQINPLHIGGLLLTLLVFLMLQLSDVKAELAEAKSEFAKSEKVAVDLSSLKAVYANKKRTKRALERILSQRSLRSAGLEIKRTKEFVKISSPSIDTRALNFLMGKILNGSYKISELKIKKLSETKASLLLEIKW